MCPELLTFRLFADVVGQEGTDVRSDVKIAFNCGASMAKPGSNSWYFG